mmetsp:Transcript_53097/g.128896  ORF Transcript_53097/g.128896 Transcript_53097/m.128896 type:complete len:1297 (+) Transcript_53097:154-4044(+)
MDSNTEREDVNDGILDSDDDGTDDVVDTTAEKVAMAEETVKIKEAKLEFLRQRRDILLTQQEKTRKKWQDLTEHRTQIQDRRRSLLKSRKRHLLLLEELQESLTKSQERLDKLTQLEALTESEPAAATDAAEEGSEEANTSVPTVEVVAGTTSYQDGEEQFSGVPNDQQATAVDIDDAKEYDEQKHKSSKRQRHGKENPTISNLPIDIPLQSQQNNSTPEEDTDDNDDDDVNSDVDEDSMSSIEIDVSGFPTLIDLNSFEILQQYHHKRLPSSSTKEVEKRSSSFNIHQQQLLNFLPWMDAEVILSHLNISTREADALDLKCTDLSISPRQELMSCTILDVSLLTNTLKHEARQDEEEGESSTTKFTSFTAGSSKIVRSTLEMPIDPNLSLCPYELSGVCADDLCPYQHTAKNPKVIARERLPLPSLAGFFPKDIKQPPSISPVVTNELAPTSTEMGPEVKTATSELSPVPDIPDKKVQSTEVDNDSSPRLSSLEKDVDKELNAIGVTNVEIQEKKQSWTLANQDDFLALPESDDDDNDNQQRNDVGNNGEGGTDMSISSSSKSSDDKNGISQGLVTRPKHIQTTRLTIMSTKDYSGEKALWWGGRLPLQKETIGEDCSIIDILESTFGLTIHKDPDDPVCDCLEISKILPPSGSVDGENSLHRVLRKLGRFVDAIRLATHSGRVDIAVTLSASIKEELNKFTSGSPDFDSGLISLMDIIDQQINAFSMHNHEYRSCFHTCLATSIGFAMISTCLFILWKENQIIDEDGDAVNQELLSSLLSTCRDCFDLMRSSQMPPKEKDGTFHQKDLNELLSFTNSETAIESVFESSKDLIIWCQAVFSPSTSTSTASSTQTTIDKLVGVVSSAKLFLRRNNHAEKPVDVSLKCLRAAIVVILSTIECVSTVISQVSRDALQQDAGRCRGLSTKNWADWTALDATIHGITKEVRTELVEYDPLMDLVIAPIFGLCATSACFIRKYSTAQNRLRDWIGENRGNQPCDGDCISLMKYSELLWSQLVQLRMNLPAMDFQPPLEITRNNASKTHRSDTTGIAKLCKKIDSVGLRLHHVAPFGDRLLTSAADGQNESSEQQCGPIQLLMKAITGTSTIAAGLVFKNVRLPIESCHSFAPSSILSPLPFLFLHVGKSLTELDLSKSLLRCLPQTFGYYFPKMKYLNLASNELNELPKSFKQLPRYMPQLLSLRLEKNRLVSLPDDMFLINGLSFPWPLYFLDLSQNHLTSLPNLPPPSLTSLEELHLGNNELTDITLIDFSRIALKLRHLRELIIEPQTSYSDHKTTTI